MVANEYTKENPKVCEHPTNRTYAGTYYDPEQDRDVMWAGCLDCGHVLAFGLSLNKPARYITSEEIV